MRQLLYVPVIHDEADLGSAGASLARASATLLGEQRWRNHLETVDRFWKGVAAFFASLEPHRLVVYQDGLAAEGDLGRRVVEEAARRGSRNYALVLDLLKRGAALRKTEDPRLVLQEREALRPWTGAEAGDPQRRQPSQEGERLLEQRDEYIAGAINATLQEHERGVLFLGAHHNVAPSLARDIRVVEVRARAQVVEYFTALLQGRNEAQLEALARRLTATIALGPI